MSKIIVVTDQPFWRGATGAHQRIYSVLQHLISQDFQLIVFYMVDRSEQDRQQCEQLNCKFVEYDARGGFIPKVLNTISKLAHSVSTNSSQNGNANDEEFSQNENVTPSLILEDYRWPHASEQFRKLVQKEKPTTVLIEYVTWAYLLEALDPNASPRSVIDTHDALHLRNAQFKANGKTHWLDISRSEEANELQRFDLVMSIQANEAELFRELAPHAQHLVVGHVPLLAGETAPIKSNFLRFGFIGSDNHANVDGIAWFIENCWPEVVAGAKQEIELVIGGPIDISLRKELGISKDSNRPNIRFIGQVNSIADFYGSVDVVLNPVRFGSGLKIKSVEAFCFGKPLVVTSHSMAGMPQDAVDAALVVDTPGEFTKSCLELVNNLKCRDHFSALSTQIGQTVFSPENVYSELVDWLRQ